MSNFLRSWRAWSGRGASTVGPLLGFEKDEEEEFQLAVSSARLRSSRRVDPALFFVLTLFMMTGWRRVYDAGHSNEMPYMVLAGIVYACCTLLYAKRGQPGGLLDFLQVKLRIKMHIFTYVLAMCLFCRHIALPNMGACSPFVPEYSALEALVVYLLWSATYPVMAAIPLRYSIVIQTIAFFGLDEASAKECDMGDVCARTDEMYNVYMRVVMNFTSILPCMFPPQVQSIAFDCRVVMGFLKLFIVVGLSAYLTYRYELNSRIIYALENGKVQILYDLSKKKSYSWQLVLELFMIENAYFKLEQESSVHEHKKQLEKDGKLSNRTVKRLGTGTERMVASENVYETLAEILQAEARVHVPNMASIERKVKALPMPLTPEELDEFKRSWMSRNHAFSPGKLQISARGRYEEIFRAIEKVSTAEEGTSKLSLHQAKSRELAQRAYAVGVRSLVYGSLGLSAFVAVSGVAAMKYFDVYSVADLKLLVESTSTPFLAALKDRAVPIKESLHAYVREYIGPGISTPEEGGHIVRRQSTELELRLKDLYSSRK
ncbi:hypothetical protein M9435_004962 [Picochlorum sp. BPE23]|nr:hypothetical protein M9435_004962 [Picochlorum sp. BPE23]